MEIVVRTVVIYFFLWGLTRAVGKRELAEMSAFELILIVTVGDLVQQAVTQEDFSLTGAVLAVGTIGLLVVASSYIAYRFARPRSVIEGLPVIIVRKGRAIDEALRVERLTLDEVVSAARRQGIDDLARIELGVLETDGKFSFLESGGGDQGSKAEASQEKHQG